MQIRTRLSDCAKLYQFFNLDFGLFNSSGWKFVSPHPKIGIN